MKIPVKDVPTPSFEDLVLIVDAVPDLRTRALISTLYLSCSRINEIVKQLKRYQLKTKVVNDEKFIWFTNVLCLKRRQEMRKTVPAKVRRDKPFLIHINDWIIAKGIEEDGYLFNIGARRSQKLIKKYCKIKGQDAFPHLFRHFRLDHFAFWGYNEQYLKHIAGWASTRMSSSYVQLNPVDLSRMDASRRN